MASTHHPPPPLTTASSILEIEPPTAKDCMPKRFWQDPLFLSKPTKDRIEIVHNAVVRTRKFRDELEDKFQHHHERVDKLTRRQERIEKKLKREESRLEFAHLKFLTEQEDLEKLREWDWIDGNESL